ncbi:MAG: hypothetical protein ACOYU2_05910 [Nitrospirota bacterium]
MRKTKLTINSQPMHLLVIVAATIIVLSLLSPVHGEDTVPQVIPSSVYIQLDAHIKRYINRYEKENCEPEPGSTCRGTEYKKARRFCSGDIDGDAKDDIAVLYTIEGFCCGNNYHYYLAVFLNRGSRFELVTSAKVGGKGERGVEFDTIRNGKILLNTEEYLPDDPMCCPTGKSRTTYSLKIGKLI